MLARGGSQRRIGKMLSGLYRSSNSLLHDFRPPAGKLITEYSDTIESNMSKSGNFYRNASSLSVVKPKDIQVF